MPTSMERAVMLAKMQQQIQEKGKVKYQKQNVGWEGTQSAAPKIDNKYLNFTSHLGKERQPRDYCKAHNLCFYCKEPYDATHAAKCSKRP